VLAEAKAKRAERMAAADERLDAAERANASASEKRASLQESLAENQRRQDELYKRTPGANVKGEQEQAEWWTKHYEEMTDLKSKEQGIMGDLRDKPVQLGADGLAKSGLFSGSALNFGMDSSTQKAQLECLKRLVRIQETHKDPHSL